jgi:dihydroxyacetone kinase-like predicted kinase
VAVCSADFENEDADAVASAFSASMAAVTTGYVSPSIRDAELNGIEIHNGDFIGFIGKQMLASHPEKAETAHTLLQKMLEDGDKFMLTVFCGKDTTEEEAATLEAYVGETYPEVEAYFLRGDQDVYPYIFVAE